jgi:hypothetical protein
MRIFANLFLILFIADGGFSLVDELVSLLTPLMPFSAFRNLLAGNVIVLSIPLYLCLGIDRRLPKKVFIPLITFVLWTLVSTWCFPALGKLRIYGLLMALTQILLGMLPLFCLRTTVKRRLTLTQESFAVPMFSLKNSLIFYGSNLFVIPAVLVMLFLTVADAYMAEHTAGFMHLAPGGLTMTERVYRRGSHSVRLAAMIHMGNKEYYRAMADSAASGRTIILAEGVTDDKNLLQENLDYGRMAGFIGLTSQQEMRFRGRIIDEDLFDSAVSGSVEGNRAGEADIFRADVDMSAFNAVTITFLEAIGKHLRESPSFARGILSLNRWAEKNITPEMYTTIMNDILHRRNMVVIGHLDKALSRYDTVVIPWGALHMKEIEAEVLKRGFVLQGEQNRISIDFRRMLQDRV